MSSVMSRCVLGVVSLVCARHAQHFVLQNGSVGPKIAQIFRCAENKKGLFIAKGGGRRKKGTDFFYVLAFCVSVVSLGCVRHMRNYNFALQNGSIGPEIAQIFRCAASREGGFSLQRGERAPKKAFFSSYFLVYFSVAGVSGAHVESMTVSRV